MHPYEEDTNDQDQSVKDIFHFERAMNCAGTLIVFMLLFASTSYVESIALNVTGKGLFSNRAQYKDPFVSH